MTIQIILSPTMKMKEEEGILASGQPVLIEKTKDLLEHLKSLSDDELKTIWGTSEKLNQLNIERIRSMDLEKNLTPAILAFQGIQYQYIGAQVLTNEDLDYLEKHLYIISGFYGLLRPLDGIVPYRLEMKSTFKDWEYSSLYDFWADKLAEEVQKDTKVILNLASKEYSKNVKKYLKEDVEMVDFVFGEMIDGKVKQKSTLLKMARGEMVQYLAKNQVTNLEEVKKFTGQAYVFSEELSSADEFVFVKEE